MNPALVNRRKRPGDLVGYFVPLTMLSSLGFPESPWLLSKHILSDCVPMECFMGTVPLRYPDPRPYCSPEIPHKGQWRVRC